MDPSFTYEFYFLVDQIDEQKTRDFLAPHKVHIHIYDDQDKIYEQMIMRDYNNVNHGPLQKYAYNLPQFYKYTVAFNNMMIQRGDKYPDYIIRLRPDVEIIKPIIPRGDVIMCSDWFALGTPKAMEIYKEFVFHFGEYEKKHSFDWTLSQYNIKYDDLEPVRWTLAPEVQLVEHMLSNHLDVHMDDYCQIKR